MTGSVSAARPAAGEIQRKDSALILRLKTLPWSRIIVDTLLMAGMMLASSRLVLR